MNLGLNIVEVDGKATPSIQGAATSVAGFVIRAQRGVPGAVRQVTSFAQFVEYFGGYLGTAYGAYAVRGFFDNGGAMAYVTRALNSAAQTAAAAATKQFQAANAAVGAYALTVHAAYRGQRDPGVWGNKIGVRITTDVPDKQGDPATFTLEVFYDGQQVETWEKLSVTGDGLKRLTKINDEFSGSKFINVAADGTVNPKPTEDATNKPVVELLTGGAEDGLSGNNLDNLFIAAFSRFDTTDIQLLACPETDSTAVVQEGLTYCANRGDSIYIGHIAEGSDVTAAKGYGKGLRGNNVYGALYFPFIRVADPIGTQKWVPPTGHVMGVYARTERERGIWKAPAGNAARVNNALDVKHQITDIQHTDLVKNGSVNAVRIVPGQGVVVDSSRSLSTNPLWHYVNVRLLFNFVKSSLKSGLRWVVQEPNDTALWNKVKYNSVTPFLMGLWRRGAFGPGQPNEVFTVKVDSDNNPPANIQQGLLNIEVYFYPSRPAETIVVTIGQQEGGAKASER